MKKEEIRKIDLACGNSKKEGFIGVDLTKNGTQADIEYNLMNFPWSFADDESVDELSCVHYIEHIPHGNGFNDPLFQFMDEAYRILKKDGIFKIQVPYYASIRAFQDPTHMRFIGEASFFYFNKKWREDVNIAHYPVSCNFEIVNIDYALNQATQGKSHESIQHMLLHNINVADDILITLKKL